jgi:bifunctional DNA-binding transcriptional regulator/antitoxin component of YhaV-PrlF toxin-antitoxin module
LGENDAFGVCDERPLPVNKGEADGVKDEDGDAEDGGEVVRETLPDPVRDELGDEEAKALSVRDKEAQLELERLREELVLALRDTSSDRDMAGEEEDEGHEEADFDSDAVAETVGEPDDSKEFELIPEGVEDTDGEVEAVPFSDDEETAEEVACIVREEEGQFEADVEPLVVGLRRGEPENMEEIEAT